MTGHYASLAMLAKRRGARQAVGVSRPATPALRPPRPWLAILALVAGTCVLFSRSLGYGFINYDDPGYLTGNPHVQAGLTWEGVSWAFAGRSDYWHPLTWLSHMLDWSLFGANAAGHRAVSIAWHAANAGLVFVVLRRLTGAAWTALLAAAVFAWHPLRVESVVWITERKDVMSGAFFLLMLWAYTDYAERLQAARPARRAYWAAVGFFAGGLMCKPSLVTAPLVLLALDFWPLRRLVRAPAAGWWRAHRCVLLEKLPFFILSGAVSVATLLMQHRIGALVLQLPLADRAGNALVSVARYLGKFLWPADLAIFYAHPGRWPVAVVAAAAALFLALTWLAWVQRGRRPWLVVGWIWFLALLLPSLGLIQAGLQSMADRYTYLSLLGVELALLLTLREIRLPAAAWWTGAGLCVAACTVGTWRQQAYWRDSLALWEHAAAIDPDNHFAQAFLGYTHFEAGHWSEAERHARRALELAADDHWAWFTLAGVQERTGRLTEAAESYRRVLALLPTSVRAHVGRALVLLRLNRPAEAEHHWLEALRLEPTDTGLWQTRAEVLAQQRRFAEAAAAYERCVTLEPRNAVTQAGLGYMLLLTGRREEAIRRWEEALRLQPDFPGLRERLERLRR
jgi:Flp pilus assembly protein TadD